jgi:uncharacterized membrane protein
LEASSSHEESSSSLVETFFLSFFVLSFVNSALSLPIYFMSSSTVGVAKVSAIDAFSSSLSGGGGVIPYPPILDIFSLSN